MKLTEVYARLVAARLQVRHPNDVLREEMDVLYEMAKEVVRYSDEKDIRV